MGRVSQSLFGQEVVAVTTGELTSRMPVRPNLHYAFVLENDLAGRAALAILWQYRDQLTVYLVADDPHERNINALQAAVSSVRHAPDIHVTSRGNAAMLVTQDNNLIWALSADRTDPTVYASLKNRGAERTFAPFLVALESLDGQHPVQSNAAHELVLRDIIREHAQFLNFFGDRFTPKDLYERSKYPGWLVLPKDFTAGIPRLARVITDADGKVLDTSDFEGSLHLPSANILEGHRVTIDLGPLIEVLENHEHDAAIDIANAYTNPEASGSLVIQVHRNGKLVNSADVATSEPQRQVLIPRITRGASLTVSILVLKDNPKTSWAKATQTTLHVSITAAANRSSVSRAKAWLKRLNKRRQLAN